MGVAAYEKEKKLTKCESDDAQTGNWTNRDVFIAVLNLFRKYSPISLTRQSNVDLSDIRFCINTLYDYGYISDQEKKQMVSYFDEIASYKRKKRRRDV
ncbi:hypothetical protein [Aeribacillus pallidus]|uniref:hypothetical protein n=1 Tax=Aeribacillus pallidus TaxID=33936 RepID=UPI003D23B39D